MENKQIELDGVIIPYVVTEEGVEYYPVKYVMEKFLLKGIGQLNKKEYLQQFMRRFEVDYSFKGTTPQETYCLSTDGWLKYFSCMRKNKNKTDEKSKRLKLFHEYLGATYTDDTIYEYDTYTLKCIENFKSKNSLVKDKKCVKCGRLFPNSHKFFSLDSRNKYGIVNTCKMCSGIAWDNYNSEEKYVYETFGIEAFNEYLACSEEFYKKYALKSNGEVDAFLNLNRIQDKSLQKHIILSTAKYLYDSGSIKDNELSLNAIKEKSNIKLVGYSNLKNNEVIEYCTNNECKKRYWRFPNYTITNMDYDTAKDIFLEYINYNNIKINNVTAYEHYYSLLKNSRLLSYTNNNKHCSIVLEFLVKVYDYKYPGYKFKLRSNNYYKNKDNCIFDMKYLIEQDLKVNINKIPLYITKYNLSKNAGQLYYAMREGGYYNDLFTWINDCYPNKFIEADFTINPFRSEFDSLEEAQVDEQLRVKLANVIYNPRTSDNSVNIYGMIPDWIVMTNKGCYLVEYFGMYTDNPGISTISYKYKIKTDKKIGKYIELEKYGYKHLFIFPNDIKNNFEGLHRKLDIMIN